MGFLANLFGTSKEALPDFGQVYDQYFQKIFNYILGRMGSVAEAEDLTAQTFYQALKHYGRKSLSVDALEPWLYRIATNEINQYFRKQSRRPYRPASEEMAQLQDQECTAADQQLAQNRVFGQLNMCLRTLKPQDQTLLALRYFEGKSHRDIAEILEIREGTCAMRVNRALDKLKQALASRGISHERFRETFREQSAGYSSSELPAQSAP